MQQIIKYVLSKYNISMESLNSKSKLHEIVECRQMIWYLTKEIHKKRYSNSKIGYHVGKRCASNVLTGIVRLNEVCEGDKNLKAKRDFYLSELLKVMPTQQIISKKLSTEERIMKLEDKVKQLEFLLSRSH